MKETLQAWEQAVYDRDAEFLDRFGHGFELVSVSWNAESMYFTYIMDDGLHVADRIDLETWLKFYEEQQKEAKYGFNGLDTQSCF